MGSSESTVESTDIKTLRTNLETLTGDIREIRNTVKSLAIALTYLRDSNAEMNRNLRMIKDNLDKRKPQVVSVATDTPKFEEKAQIRSDLLKFAGLLSGSNKGLPDVDKFA